MTKPKKQHIAPVTYLKQFHIGDKKNIYCIDCSDHHKLYVQRIGLGDKRLTIKNFYTDNRLENHFAIENFFAKEVEPLYPSIINAINEEKPLSEEIKAKIILWIFCSDMRKATKRGMYEGIIKWTCEVISAYKKEEIPGTILTEYSKRLAKDIQLNPFSDETQVKELFSLFEKTLALKQWRILKTTNDNPFWTNDSPVFSPNLHPQFSKDTPYHMGAELNGNSFVYFILSPYYCLEISPFYEGTPLDATLWNMDIPFETASPLEVKFINTGVYYTCNNLIISNNKNSLENGIKFKEKEF